MSCVIFVEVEIVEFFTALHELSIRELYPQCAIKVLIYTCIDLQFKYHSIKKELHSWCLCNSF